MVARYLRETISLNHTYNLKHQRPFLESHYNRFFIQDLVKRLNHEKDIFLMEFRLFRALKNPGFMQAFLNRDFLNKHSQSLHHLLPQKKSDKLFLRTLQSQDQKLVFDRMYQSKFQEARKIMDRTKSLSRDDKAHIQRFLRIKMPEVLKEQKSHLWLTLHSLDLDLTPYPLLNLIRDVFTAPSLDETLEAISEQKYTHERTAFLQERALNLLKEDHSLLALSLVAAELFHECAPLFDEEQKAILEECLQLCKSWLHFMPEAVLTLDKTLGVYQEWVTLRAQDLYNMAIEPLGPLNQQVHALYQNYQASHNYLESHARQAHAEETQSPEEQRYILQGHYSYDLSQVEGYQHMKKEEEAYQKVHQLYQNHINDITEAFHKRTYGLQHMGQSEPPEDIKVRLEKKLQGCLKYLSVSASKVRQEKKPVLLRYKKHSKNHLQALKESLVEQFKPENESENHLYNQVFDKANQVLVGLNKSKSSVKFNLKQLFEEEPNIDLFAAQLYQRLCDFEAWLENSQASQITDYLLTELDIYPALLDSLKYVAVDPIHSGTECTGYILSYLCAIEYKKVLKDLKYHQINFDFDTLFCLAHAFCILDRVQHTHGNIPDLQVFKDTLIPAWDVLMEYCLPVGKGKFKLLWNPLSLFVYEYQAPIEIGESQFDPQKTFDPLTMATPVMSPAQPSSPPKASASPRSEEEDVFEAEDILELDTPDLLTTTEDIYRTHKPAAKTSQKNLHRSAPTEEKRKIPHYQAPGKFELYTAPTRRNPVAPISHQGVSLEDDELFGLMGQTIITNPSQNQSPPANPPEQAPAETKPDEKERKRWLEVTPSPAESDFYDDLVDNVLSKQKPKNSPKKRQNTEIRDYNSLVDEILKNNQLSDSADFDVSQTITKFTPKDNN